MESPRVGNVRFGIGKVERKEAAMTQLYYAYSIVSSATLLSGAIEPIDRRARSAIVLAASGNHKT